MSQNPEKHYQYKMKIGQLLEAMFVCCLLSFWSANTAIENTKALRINFIIYLSPENATIFFWILSAIMGSIALFVFYCLIRHPGELDIILGETTVTIPHAVTGKSVTIPYTQIRNVRLIRRRDSAMLAIRYRGKKAHISSLGMDDDIAFEDLFHELKRRSYLSILPIKN